MIKLKSLEIFNFKRYEYAKLEFPSHGKFLIKGKNEAGKSSIFEAIIFALFGRPVYINGQENLINFSAKKAQVVLHLDLDDKEIYIKRTLERNSSQECQLRIKDKNNPLKPISITKVTEVNKRIEKELGLDYTTLLNTCFVEQKNIGRLENSKKEERQKVIVSLFNLDFLNNLSKKAKEEEGNLEKKLIYAETIREACNAKRNYPIVEEELSKIKKEKTEIEAIEKAKKIKEERDYIKILEEEIEKFSKAVEDYGKKVELLKNYENELDNLERIFELQERCNEKIRDKERLELKIKEIEKEMEQIQVLQKEREKLKHYINIKKRQKTLEIIREKIKKWEEEIRRWEEKKKEEERLLKDLEEIYKKEKEVEKLDIISEEIKKLENTVELKNLEEKIVKIKEHDTYEKQINNLCILLKKLNRKIAFSFSFSILFLILSFSFNLLFTIPFITFLIITFIFYSQKGKLNTQKITLKTRKEDIEKDLKNINKEEIQSRYERLREEIKSEDISITELISLKAKREKEIEDLKGLEKNLSQLKKETENILLNLGFKDFPKDTHLQLNLIKEDIKEIEENILKLQEFKKKKIEQWERLWNKISILDETNERLETLNKKEAQIEERIKYLKSLSNEIEKNKEEIIRIEEDIKKIQNEIAETTKNLIEPPSQKYKEKLENNIKELREEKVEEKFEYSKKFLNQKTGEKNTHEKILANLISEFQDKYSEKDWEELCGKEIDYKKKKQIEEKEKELNEKLIRLKTIMERYQKETGRKIEDLDPDKEEEEVNKMEREKLKMSYAQQILEGTKKKILDAISPRTLSYMQKILPILTMDRYHIVHLDSETFRLKVYDNTTKKYYDKDILSGGTQDQFSLALRLAFAIANLPQNKGTNPGFIFLDEPLGSFDEERAQALIELLTYGEIAEHFDQIFVITHVLLKEEFFDYCIYVENGKIISNEL
ncbi:MAG: AAA family ATPase [Dictyoglomaceae bacterium]